MHLRNCKVHWWYLQHLLCTRCLKIELAIDVIQGLTRRQFRWTKKREIPILKTNLSVLFVDKLRLWRYSFSNFFYTHTISTRWNEIIQLPGMVVGLMDIGRSKVVLSLLKYHSWMYSSLLADGFLWKAIMRVLHKPMTRSASLTFFL